jgi:predicted metal-dependent HD superfamily phosphohydrolase
MTLLPHSKDFWNPQAVLLAVAWHDAVLVPGARDNEKRSIDAMVESVRTLVPQPTWMHAETLIRMSADHFRDFATFSPSYHGPLTPRTTAYDAACFLDADLAIWGRAWPRVMQAEVDLAAEFTPFVGDAAYLEGRIAFLKSALAQPEIYRTHWARAWEPVARANLRRLIDLLCDEGLVPLRL